jgi:hypothetical protein
MWTLLFVNDKIHASIHGSYLFACGLYATIFGHLPDKDIVGNPELLQYLYMDSRKLLGGQSPAYLTWDDVEYLLNVTERVALKGYVPSSFYGTVRRKREFDNTLQNCNYGYLHMTVWNTLPVVLRL